MHGSSQGIKEYLMMIHDKTDSQVSTARQPANHLNSQLACYCSSRKLAKLHGTSKRGFMKHAVEAFKLLKLHPPNWGPILVSSSWPSAQVFSGSNLIFCIFAVTLASARLGCDPKLTLSRLDVSTRGQHHLSVQVRLPGTQPFTI